ncbi:major facilitator superfamily domain-containing protein [Xylariaceae sp. FL0255]|nr:major facilitator superfamily domain-containing protein [Xylariaceae sp. FL0255]
MSRPSPASSELDCLIMPILVIMYILNYLDRQNISAARLTGFQQDLSLSNVEYQTAVSILFVGYILAQTTSNLVASRLKQPGGFAGIIVIRLVLGVIEAAFFPGALFLLSQFYSRKQFDLRTAILYAGSQVGNAIGGLFAIGVLKLDGKQGISGWRWLFIIEGALTVFFAIAFAFIIPNDNKKILGLNEVEHEYVRWNYASDMGQEDDTNEITRWQALVIAVSDPKTWLLTGLLYATYNDGTVVQFFPSVVAGLGVIVILINGWHSDKTRERFWHIVGPLVITLIANIIAMSTLSIAGRYIAILLLPGSFYGSAVITLSWVTGSLGQPRVKRTAAIAFINSLYNTPNI